MVLAVLIHCFGLLLAEGQPLDAALLFAMNSLGGLNCIKVTLFRVPHVLDGLCIMILILSRLLLKDADWLESSISICTQRQVAFLVVSFWPVALCMHLLV